MNKFLIALVCALVTSGFLFSLQNQTASSKPAFPENKVPGAVESTARRLMNSLKKEGYEIQRGYVKLYTEQDCPVSFAEMGNCFGNNPAAPYIMFSVPPWPGEYIDPATDEAFGLNRAGYSTSYRLDPREALVILGKLPPPAAYFGLQSYLFTRQAEFKQDSPQYLFMQDKPPLMRMFFQKVPQNPDRVVSLASLSNSLNHVVIERQSQAAFEQQRYFIITPDEGMDRKIRESLGSLSIDEKDIFTEPVPSNTIVGLDEAADDFISLIRYAMPEDGGVPGSASAAWRKELPLVVLRVRDMSLDRLPEPYPPFTAPEPRQAEDERYLLNDLRSLVQAVSVRWEQPAAAAQAMMLLRVQPPPVRMVGSDCIPIGMNCLADTQDTSYQYSFPLPVGSSSVYALVGTLGTQTGNATYVGLGLTSTIRMLGFDNLSELELKDSAGSFAGSVNHTDKFFVYYFSRDCSELGSLTLGNCREISAEDLPPCSDPTASTCDKLSLSLRDYMLPGSQRGPDDVYVLPAWVLPLQRP